ncbi:MAG: biotin transporter BioY [Deltaproteobacteria bacterium]|nr:MAG: biotin transporter BioY [Deltaproteobacteria bacterium]RLC22637.1 MAG: biotin transporter BioY [Deltaproteobacteria bacterium]
MNDSKQLRMTVYTSLFVALIAIGAFIAIPIGPVPIVLQNMFVLLAAIILGPVWGLSCVAVYLLIGLAGLPVFSAGGSGIGKLFGPTGGYLLGYLPCVFVTAIISKGLGKKMSSDIIAMVIGSLIVYAAGVPWLKAVTAMTFEKALTVGMIPFLPGDVLKIIAAAFIARTLRPVIKL